MKIKAIAPWFGGKRNLAARIVETLGPHRAYWEPFCGSMAVLFNKPPCEMETVNDLHGDLINLARVIQDRELGFQLYDKLNRTLYAEQFFRESRKRWAGKTNGEPDIGRAYDYFVISWMGLNGMSGTHRSNHQFALRWCRGGGQGARRWRSVVESMPTWHERLQNVVIIKKDAFEILGKIKDSKDTAIYCDPPYLKKGAKYIHDFEASDHERLAKMLHRFRNAKIVVSYYEEPELKMLYPAWRQIEFNRVKSLANQNKRGKLSKNTAKEVLLINDTAEGLFNG